MKLINKNVIITGATGGLGKNITTSFLMEGANLILIGKDFRKLKKLKIELENIKAKNQFIDLITIDLSNLNSIEKIVKKKLIKISKIDVLINCAAIQGPVGKSWKNNFHEWMKTFNINFYSTMLMTNSILPFMIKKNSGSIINISGGGSTSSRPDFSSYAISKTAIVRYTEILSEELKNTSIKVNAIAPGVMATNMIKELLKNKKNISNSKELISAKKVLIEGDDMSKATDLCIFLSSDESNGISGKLISAIWDPWTNFKKNKKILSKSDLYTLRRILPEDRGINLV